MFKTLAMLLALLLPTTVLAANVQKEMLSPIMQINSNCSVSIVKSDDQGTFGLTAAHCVSEEVGIMNMDVYDKDMKFVSKSSEYYDRVVLDTKNDTAVLKFRNTTLRLPVAKIATESPQEGEQVWTVGFPLGFAKMLSSGFYGGKKNVDPVDGGAIRQLATPDISFGNSGGAMFRIEDGEYKIVGVTSAMMAAGFVPIDHFGIYTTLESIKENLKVALPKETTKLDEK